MVNRRKFMQSSLASVPVYASAPLVFGSQEPNRNMASLPIYTMVYDRASPDSVRFSQAASNMGQRISSILHGDVTRLWYDDLYHQWQIKPVAIAGLTTPDAFFCLNTFAQDSGLKTIFSVEHIFRREMVEHKGLGIQSLLNDEAWQAGDWSERMALLLLSYPVKQEHIHIPAQKAIAAQSHKQSGRANLISWLMVPRRDIS